MGRKVTAPEPARRADSEGPSAECPAESVDRVLGLVPYVVSTVETSRNKDGLAEIRIPRPRTRWVRFLCFIFRLPDYKILILDETGTEMLELIDGQRTFRDLAKHLEETKSLTCVAAQASMAAFLRRLDDERVISVRGDSGETPLEGAVD